MRSDICTETITELFCETPTSQSYFWFQNLTGWWPSLVRRALSIGQTTDTAKTWHWDNRQTQPRPDIETTDGHRNYRAAPLTARPRTRLVSDVATTYHETMSIATLCLLILVHPYSNNYDSLCKCILHIYTLSFSENAYYTYIHSLDSLLV